MITQYAMMRVTNSLGFNSPFSSAIKRRDCELDCRKRPFVIARPFLTASALAALLFTLHPSAAAQVVTAPTTEIGRSRDASIDEYRQHLTQLTTLIQACAKARDTKTCDPTLVGLDDRVPTSPASNADRRLIRYGWLRILFSKAQDPDAPPPKPADPKTAAGEDNSLPPSPTTTQLLQAAHVRLADDLAQTSSPNSAAPQYSQQRDQMKQVLAGRDFRNLEAPTARDSMLEKLGNWLNSLFESAARVGARAAWIGRLIVWGFFVAVCIGLIWALIQLERRWRIRLIPESSGPAPGSASARDWQLWLEDARRAAAAGNWREAIHFLYWASISRLESRRLWPADRARTPREYLALVASEDPRRPGLATLTSSFERIWYGGRTAAESDYRKAEQLATFLISGGSSSGGAA